MAVAKQDGTVVVVVCHHTKAVNHAEKVVVLHTMHRIHYDQDPSSCFRTTLVSRVSACSDADYDDGPLKHVSRDVDLQGTAGQTTPWNLVAPHRHAEDRRTHGTLGVISRLALGRTKHEIL